MVMGIGHCAFVVSDMEASLAFYEKTLGFEKAFEINREESGEPWIVYMYAGGNQFVELFYGGKYTREFSDANIGFYHLCLQVDDIHAAWLRIKESGAPCDDAPKTASDHNWQCWTHDPDGNKIELMQLAEESPHMKFIRSKQS